jgi:autotransporter-associated beta strand protein
MLIRKFTRFGLFCLCMHVIQSALNPALAQTSVTYNMQTGNFNVLNTEKNNNPPYAGTYNNGASEMAQYANSGSFGNTPGAAAFQTFTTTGNGNTGTARTLRPGDRFTITVYTGSNPSGGGRIGISFRNTTTVSNFFSSTDANTVARFQIENTGGWKIYHGAGNTENTGATSGSDRTLSIEITSSNTFNATIGGTSYYDLSFAATGPIAQFCIYTFGDNNPDAYWKTGSLSNFGHSAGDGLRFGYDMSSGTRTISGNITDGANTNNASIALANRVLCGSFGTINFSGTGSSYTGATTVNAGARMELQSAQALGNTSGVTVTANGAISLFNATGISYNSYLTTINGQGQGGSNGAFRSTGGNNTWPGAVTLGSASRINADASGAAGSLTLSGSVSLGSNTLSVGGSASGVTISGKITGTGSLVKDGNNTLTLSNTTNDYTGGTAINEGVVSVSDNAMLGSGNLTLGSGTNNARLNITSSTTRSQGIAVADGSTGGAIDVASGQTLTFSGALTQGGGTNNATKFGKSGAGTLNVSNASTGYVGQIQIGEGTVIVQNNNGLGNNTTTANRGIDLGLNVGDVSQPNNVVLQATNGITVPQSIYVSSNQGGASRTISLNGSGSASFSAEIYTDGDLTLSGGSGTLTMSGNIISPVNNRGINISGGIVVLGGANTYSGNTTISGGTLRLGAANTIANTSNIVLSGGTLSSNGNSDIIGTLNLTASTASTIALTSANHSLTFANSSALSPWGAGATLTITGWNGTAGVSNTGGPRIFVGVGGLTSAQLAKISFTGYAGTAVILASTGELVPPAVPQGSLSANGPFCNSGAGQLTWTASSGTGPYTLVYNDGTANRTETNVVSGTPFNTFTTPVTNTTTYTLVSVTDANTVSRNSGFTGAAATITLTENVFTGNGNWTDGNNWSCGVAPAAGDVFSIGAGKSAVLNTNLNVSGTFTLDATSTLTINPGRELAVALGGTVNINGASVTLKSDASGTAAIGKIIGTLSGATNVTVERYIPVFNSSFSPSHIKAWRLLAVPTYTSGSGGQTIRQAWQENGVNNNGYGVLLGFPSSNFAALGYDRWTSPATIQQYSGTAWINIANTNATKLDSTGAYFVFVRGNRTVETSTAVTDNSKDATLRTTGRIYQGNGVTGAALPTSFSVVGNIYPSAIDFVQLQSNNSSKINSVYYLWDSRRKNGTSLGSYQTFSGTNSYGCTPGGGSFTLNQVNTTIQSGQGFFVSPKNPGTGQRLIFDENIKLSGSSNNAFRPTVPSNRLVKIDTRLLDGENSEVADGNTVVFGANYANAVDGDDAQKLMNSGENFGIQKGNARLAVEGRQPVAAGDEILFATGNLKEKTYVLDIAAQNIDAEQLTATLEDRYTQSSILLNLNGSTQVPVAVDGNAASKAADRFRIVFGKPAVSGKAGFAVAPNPVEGSTINVRFMNQPEGRYTARILSVDGKVVQTTVLEHTGGNATQILRMNTKFAAGTYQLELTGLDRVSRVIPVLVQ